MEVEKNVTAKKIEVKKKVNKSKTENFCSILILISLFCTVLILVCFNEFSLLSSFYSPYINKRFRIDTELFW